MMVKKNATKKTAEPATAHTSRNEQQSPKPKTKGALAIVGHHQLPAIDAERITMLPWPDKVLRFTRQLGRLTTGAALSSPAAKAMWFIA